MDIASASPHSAPPQSCPFRQAIRAEKKIISLGTEPWQHVAPGCLTHCLDHGAPGFPLSRGLDRHEPGHGLTVTGQHNFVASLGAAQKVGKLCFGIVD